MDEDENKPPHTHRAHAVYSCAGMKEEEWEWLGGEKVHLIFIFSPSLLFGSNVLFILHKLCRISEKTYPKRCGGAVLTYSQVASVGFVSSTEQPGS